MKPIHLIFAMAMGLFVSQNVFGSAFKTATVTEVINDVKVLKGAGKPAPAKVKETITAQDIIRTGRDSRTELRFQDNTLARVGANSVFSFAPDSREINLQQGSVLFNSDKGRGGGQIKTAAATAAVTGTTIIVAATANGGFKLLILEGKSRVQLPGGAFVDMQAGQMTFINPGQNTRPEVLTFDLEALIKGSKLVEGFSDPLDSMEKVQSAIDKQNKLIADGKLDETGQLIVFVNEQGDVQIIDMNSLTQILDIDLAAQLAQEGINNLPQFDFTALTAAFGRNYIQNLNTINPADVFADVALLKASPFNSDGFYNNIPNTAAYLPANNLTIAVSSIDFSPYSGNGTFAFLAEGDMNFNTTSFNLEFAGPISEVAFFARGDFIFPSSTSITTSSNAVSLAFNGGGNMNLPAYSSIYANGDINIDLGGDFSTGAGVYINGYTVDITIDGDMDIFSSSIGSYSGALHLGALGQMSLDGTTLSSGGNITLDSNTGFNIMTGSTLVSYGGGIIINNTNPSGLTSISASTIGDTGFYYPLNFTLNANQTSSIIDISGSSFYGSSGSINLMGGTGSGGAININSMNIYGVNAIAMQAYTINLQNINFPGGSTVNLTSGLPNGSYPNFGGSMNGRVNFISGVSYGGNAIVNESTFDSYGSGSIFINP